MKSNDIRRSVRASRNERTAGDAPNIGRVARMPGTGLPKGERRRRRRGEGGRNNKIRAARRVSILIWTWLIVGLSVGVFATVLVLWVGPKLRRATSTPGVAATVAPAPAAAPRFPEPAESEGLALVRQALGADTPEMVETCFRLAGTDPREALEFVRGVEAEDGPVSRYRWLGIMNASGLQLQGALVYFRKDGAVRNRLAVLTPDADGRWQVDFDAFARTVKPPWPQILKSAGEPAIVRIYAAKDNYFNGPYADDTVWDCYGIASPDTSEILKAYCRKDSPQGLAMSAIAGRSASPARAVLEIRHDPAALPGQFEISRVLAEDWVVPQTPFDERFQ